MKNVVLYFIIFLLLNSCASILNGEKTVVKISADKESKIIYKKDTISINKKQTTIRPIRSKKPLKITVLKDSLKEDFYLESKLSEAFWQNILNYGVGMLVDLSTDKRFTYNRYLHFVTDSIQNKIVLSNKKVTVMPKNKFLVYTSPLQFLDFFSIPMVTLGTEYFIKDNFSLSAEYGVKIADNYGRRNSVITLKDKAINYRLETKWYNKINLTGNVHLNEYFALEFRQIISQYNDKLEYGFKNDANRTNSIRDDFATKKRVTIVNLKHGLLVPIGNRFYFDFYYGLGVRIKKFQNFNYDFDGTIHTIYDEDDLPTISLSDFQDFSRTPLLNITAGFKLGFKL